MRLDQLDTGTEAVVESVDWSALADAEAHRLRLLGVEEGARVELLHRGMLFWKDPLAIRIGRMTIALRLAHARLVECSDARNVQPTANVDGPMSA